MQVDFSRDELLDIKNAIQKRLAFFKEIELKNQWLGDAQKVFIDEKKINNLKSVLSKIDKAFKSLKVAPKKRKFLCGHKYNKYIVCDLEAGHEGKHFNKKLYWKRDLPCWYPPPVLGPKFIKEGEYINYGANSWFVKKYDPEMNLIIEVIKCEPYFKNYLDIGQEYTLKEHKYNRYQKDLEIWEISGEQMKRSSSQMLLYLLPEGPSIDLDF